MQFELRELGNASRSEGNKADSSHVDPLPTTDSPNVPPTAPTTANSAPQVSRTTTRREIVPLTALRGILALWVWALHVTNWNASEDIRTVPHFLAANGRVSVTVFFALSGFLMAYLAQQECDLETAPCVHHFRMKRVARIVPTYWTALFIAVPVYAAIRGIGPQHTFSLVLMPFGLHTWIPVLSQTANETWSIAAELFFYFVFPYLFRFFRPRILTAYKSAPRAFTSDGLPSEDPKNQTSERSDNDLVSTTSSKEITVVLMTEALDSPSSNNMETPAQNAIEETHGLVGSSLEVESQQPPVPVRYGNNVNWKAFIGWAIVIQVLTLLPVMFVYLAFGLEWVEYPTVWRALYFSPPLRHVEFWMGILVGLARASRPVQQWVEEARSGKHPNAVVGIDILLLSILVGAVAMGQDYALVHIIACGGFCAFAATVVFFLSMEVGWFAWILSQTPLVHLGRISYQYYLVHTSVILLFQGHMDGWVTGVATFALSAIVAAAIHLYVEKPCYKLIMKRWPSKCACAVRTSLGK